MGIISTLFVFLLFVFYIKTKLRSEYISANLLIFAFTLKTIVGIFFIYYFLNIGYKSDQPSDVYRFLFESKLLNDVYYKSPSDYFKLLFGIKDYFCMNSAYFKDAFIWKADEYSIINETRNVIRVHSLIHFISFNNPFIHVLLFNFITLIGLKKLTEAFFNFTKIKLNIVFIILLVIPSLLFWTSGILKESFILVGLGFIVNAILCNNSRKKTIINLSIGIIILIFFKTYILLCLIPTFAFIYIASFFNKNKIVWSSSIIGILILTLFLFKPFQNKLTKNITKKQLDLINVGEGGIHLEDKKHTYYFTPENYKNLKLFKNKAKLIAPSYVYLYDRTRPRKNPILTYIYPTNKIWKQKIIMPKSNSFFEVTRVNDSFKQLILNIPEALINACFRPFQFNNQGLLQKISFIEMIAITFFFLFSIFNFRKLKITEKQIVIALCLFAFVLLLLIGWTTPISGLLVRLRFPAQLALILVSIIIIKFNNKRIFNE